MGAPKNTLKPWLKRSGCISTVSTEFVRCMGDVLDLDAEHYDPQYPVVCFDEKLYRLIRGVCQWLPPTP
jgi:hypothetical protein